MKVMKKRGVIMLGAALIMLLSALPAMAAAGKNREELEDEEGSYSVSTVAFTEDGMLILPRPVKKGKSFIEWNTGKDGGGRSYKAGEIIDPEDTVLYSIWEDDVEEAKAKTEKKEKAAETEAKETEAKETETAEDAAKNEEKTVTDIETESTEAVDIETEKEPVTEDEEEAEKEETAEEASSERDMEITGEDVSEETEAETEPEMTAAEEAAEPDVKAAEEGAEEL